ncbi:hypothetical protein ACRAWG_24530 [Methylobacterium sp. P31]
MAILRYVLLGFSVLALALVMVFWTISGRASDLVLFLTVAFLVANIIYISLSSPNVKISSIFDRAASGLAFASLELQHHAKEAKIREAEAERIRAEEAEHRQHKLKAAEEFMTYLRQNPLARIKHAPEARHIALRPDSKGIAFPALEIARSPQADVNARFRGETALADDGGAASPPGGATLLEGQRQR